MKKKKKAEEKGQRLSFLGRKKMGEEERRNLDISDVCGYQLGLSFHHRREGKEAEESVKRDSFVFFPLGERSLVSRFPARKALGQTKYRPLSHVSNPLPPSIRTSIEFAGQLSSQIQNIKTYLSFKLDLLDIFNFEI